MKLSNMEKYRYMTCAELEDAFLKRCLAKDAARTEIAHTEMSHIQRREKIAKNRAERYASVPNNCDVCGNPRHRSALWTWEENGNVVGVCERCYNDTYRKV